jgi:hypothetical protein
MIHATERPTRRTQASADSGARRRRRAASVSDAVIAAYIHELRHADLTRRAEPRSAGVAR